MLNGTRFITHAVAHSHEPVNAPGILDDQHFAYVVVNHGSCDLHFVGPSVLAQILQVGYELAPLIGRARCQSSTLGACWASARFCFSSSRSLAVSTSDLLGMKCVCHSGLQIGGS